MPNDQFLMDKTTNQYSPVVPKAKQKAETERSIGTRWAQSQYLLFSRAIDITKSMQAFSQSRLAENADAWKSAMFCRDPAALAGLQRLHLASTAEQYRDFALGISTQLRQCADDMTASGNNIRRL